jgi:RNA polymerase sigma-70 factor (ECF subfamily)
MVPRASHHLRLVNRPEPPPAPADEPEAFRDLFERYAAYVGKIAFRMLGRQEDAEDVVQDVFVVAYRRRREVGQLVAPRQWLAAVAVKRAHHVLRRRRWRAMLGADLPEYEAAPDPGASPEQRALVTKLNRVLDELPAKERIAWVLRHLEGEQLEDVARIVGCSLATVKRRIAAAHETVKEMMGHE